MATWRLFLLASALVLAPAAANAQADDNPEGVAHVASEAPGASLDCHSSGLRIMAAEVSGARFVCAISGAAATDSSFSVQAVSPADQTHTMVPLCSGNLASGAGTCSGAFIDRATGSLAQVTLVVTLQPSGAALGPAVIGPASPAPAASEPMQFYPLPEP